MQGLRRACSARDERGAYSVLFALLTVVMFGISALAVDLGNAFSRKSDVQGQADFAALAGGHELKSSNPSAISPDVLAAVAKSLNFNQPVNGTCTSCVTTSQLVNGDLADGEVQIITGKGLRVTAPASTVDYGFAGAIGQAEEKDVQASATVQIFSPGNGSMPMYAAAGCDYGQQILTDPSTGHVSSTHDNLAFGADDSAAELWSITSPSPAAIPLSTGPGPMLRVTGEKFAIDAQGQRPAYHVSKIGFFLNDGTTHHVVNVTAPTPPAVWDPYFAEIPAIPAAVASVEDVWWVRVYLVEDGAAPPPGEWSSEGDARPLRVGAAQLECDAGSSDGNFGTLRLPRADVPSGSNLSMNIADGFDDPLSLVVHEGADSTGHCTPGLPAPPLDPAVESEEPDRLRAGTNCVGTDPGLSANDAASGLIEGVGSTPGRLDAPAVCGPKIANPLHRGPSTINGDTLECFLTSGTVTAITSPTYNGGAVLTQEIFDSPRFFWVPVLTADATRGASERYSIIDFRPAFLSDLHVQGNDIDQVKVIFFNWHALPGSTDGDVSPYLGVGKPILRLID
ncbi:TadE/TadG family type IV pilus assembly protein [Nocardioides cavernaquae]|uniref:Pilus assembly protein n=1 Tax=Nocardioides cavernaquae TaxID=2321396 RepID=A0A3A5H4K9_9ACTN|nr:TadE/TadG family type IV pilus assembly protein [Nocardioides cavernaquae]RJS44831.1 pilus assembly protein [Nocardioides cavernaquae]